MYQKLTYEQVRQRFAKWEFEMNIAAMIRLFGEPDKQNEFMEMKLPDIVHFHKDVFVSRVRIAEATWEADIRLAISDGYCRTLQYYNPEHSTWYPISTLSVDQTKTVLHFLNIVPMTILRNSK